eukprot:6449041-Amphidinium_carterae.1
MNNTTAELQGWPSCAPLKSAAAARNRNKWSYSMYQRAVGEMSFQKTATSVINFVFVHDPIPVVNHPLRCKNLIPITLTIQKENTSMIA